MARFLQGVAEYLAPVLRESHFVEKGVLTPEEFVLAGDNLVFKCPTWEWSVSSRWPCVLHRRRRRVFSSPLCLLVHAGAPERREARSRTCRRRSSSSSRVEVKLQLTSLRVRPYLACVVCVLPCDLHVNIYSYSCALAACASLFPSRLQCRVRGACLRWTPRTLRRRR
jgi:hypothetical protein